MRYAHALIRRPNRETALTLVLLSFISAPNATPLLPATTVKKALNDTGVTTCADAYSSKRRCPAPYYPRQDAETGRDKLLKRNDDGRAGFSFTKLDSDGKPLAASATDWSCVRDNVTGLTWEKKPKADSVQGSQGLHDADDRFTWYNASETNDGGFAGFADEAGNRECYGYNADADYGACNSEDYVARVNAEGWCGAQDWRVPTVKELEGLLDFSVAKGIRVDTAYFDDGLALPYWTASADANYILNAWSVDFGSALSNNTAYRSQFYPLRLVRGK